MLVLLSNCFLFPLLSSTHHEVVVVVGQSQAVSGQNILQQICVAAEGRIDNDWLALELVNAGDGRDGREHQIRALIQLADDGHVLVLVEAVVERIVDGRRQDVVLAVEDGRKGRRAVGHLVVDDIEAVFGEEAQLVGDGIGGCGQAAVSQSINALVGGSRDSVDSQGAVLDRVQGLGASHESSESERTRLHCSN